MFNLKYHGHFLFLRDIKISERNLMLTNFEYGQKTEHDPWIRWGKYFEFINIYMGNKQNAL